MVLILDGNIQMHFVNKMIRELTRDRVVQREDLMDVKTLFQSEDAERPGCVIIGDDFGFSSNSIGQREMKVCEGMLGGDFRIKAIEYIKTMLNEPYPKFMVLSEDDSPELQEACRQYGVLFVDKQSSASSDKIRDFVTEKQTKPFRVPISRKSISSYNKGMNPNAIGKEPTLG